MSKATDSIPKGFENLVAALEAAKRPFFCTGTLPLDVNKRPAILVAEVSEGKPSNFHPVYFPLKDEGDIEPLLKASRQAPFSRGNQEILDPLYHHGLVLHKENFSIYPHDSLDPHGLGIITSIAKTLLPSSLLARKDKVAPKDSDEEEYYDSECSEMEEEYRYGGPPMHGSTMGLRKKADEEKEPGIIACLDKLNVYTCGDFFKEHVDTPRSPDMFGTLLINLPTKHEGGQLVVRAPIGASGGAGTERDEYTTNWGDLNLEWIAFFSDCEHEVLPVTSGNRVTISYTLSFDTTGGNDAPFDVQALAGSKDLNRDNLYRELIAPGILTKEQPRLCFYLEHRYPMNGDIRADTIKPKLKGRDAALYHAFIRAGVSVTFHHVLFLQESGGYSNADGIVAEDETFTGELHAILPQDARTIEWETENTEARMDGIMLACKGRTPRALGIIEVNKGGRKFVRVDYPACGKDAMIGHDYGTVCMVASMKGLDVDEPWERKLKRKRRRRPW